MKKLAATALSLILPLALSLTPFAVHAETLVKLETTLGDITLSLDENRAPKTVENFINYVDSGFYNGLVFHRVIPNFMIQGGGMTADMAPRATNDPIQNEANNGLLNKRGSISMARTNAPHSATSQFFINTKDNDFLNYAAGNPGYAVFGQVIDGMDVVDQISQVKTGIRSYYENVPTTPIEIKSANRITEPTQ